MNKKPDEIENWGGRNRDGYCSVRCVAASLFFSAAIKVGLRSNESMGWGLSSLCCVLCPPLMGSRCGGISQVWLWKTFPHINPIRSDPEHELAGELVSRRACSRPPKLSTDSVDLNYLIFSLQEKRSCRVNYA